LLDEIHAG
jgi:hypothetical protein